MEDKGDNAHRVRIEVVDSTSACDYNSYTSDCVDNRLVFRHP